MISQDHSLLCMTDMVIYKSKTTVEKYMYWMSAQDSIPCVCENEYPIMEVVPGISKSSSKHTMRMLRNMDVKPKFKIIDWY